MDQSKKFKSQCSNDTPAPEPLILKLPHELLFRVFSFLSTKCVFRVAQTCKALKEIALDNSVALEQWRKQNSLLGKARLSCLGSELIRKTNFWTTLQDQKHGVQILQRMDPQHILFAKDFHGYFEQIEHVQCHSLSVSRENDAVAISFWVLGIPTSYYESLGARFLTAVWSLPDMTLQGTLSFGSSHSSIVPGVVIGISALKNLVILSEIGRWDTLTTTTMPSEIHSVNPEIGLYSLPTTNFRGRHCVISPSEQLYAVDKLPRDHTSVLLVGLGGSIVQPVLEVLVVAIPTADGEVVVLKHHKFSKPDGRHVFSITYNEASPINAFTANSDSSVSIWDIAKNELVATISLPSELVTEPKPQPPWGLEALTYMNKAFGIVTMSERRSGNRDFVDIDVWALKDANRSLQFVKRHTYQCDPDSDFYLVNNSERIVGGAFQVIPEWNACVMLLTDHTVVVIDLETGEEVHQVNFMSDIHISRGNFDLAVVRKDGKAINLVCIAESDVVTVPFTAERILGDNKES